MRTVKLRPKGRIIELPEGFLIRESDEVLVVVEGDSGFSDAPVRPWWEMPAAVEGTMTGAEIDAYLKVEKESWNRP